MLASIKQVCVRRSTSVSHSMARLPVWSPAWGSIEYTRLADLDGSCAFPTLLFLFLSSCFLFFLPMRTCTSSFFRVEGCCKCNHRKEKQLTKQSLLHQSPSPSYCTFDESACSEVITWPWTYPLSTNWCDSLAWIRQHTLLTSGSLALELRIQCVNQRQPWVGFDNQQG